MRKKTEIKKTSSHKHIHKIMVNTAVDTILSLCISCENMTQLKNTHDVSLVSCRDQMIESGSLLGLLSGVVNVIFSFYQLM